MATAVTRTDVVGRRLLEVAAPLPLAFPSFVGATALRAAVGPGGIVADAAGEVGLESVPSMRGFVGAWLVLTLFTYPYVYLPVRARLASLPARLEESARLLGASPIEAFARVTWPQIVSSMLAGALLVFLYAISDFGAVSLMGYGTLTEQIYADQLFDQPRAMTLSLVLGVTALAVVALERSVRGRARPGAMASADGSRVRLALLGGWRWPVAIGSWFVVLNALVGPVLVLGLWALRGLTSSSDALGVRLRPTELIEPTLRSGGVSVVTAATAVMVVLPVVWLTRRYRSRLGESANALVVAGFALPGVVIALALALVTLRVAPMRWAYQTLPLLVGAYVIHFGAQAARSASVAVDSLDRSVSDAARTLGASRWRRFGSVELPAMVPALVAGGGLVLLSTMKELPVTLMLAPIGFDTLATRIWSATAVGTWAQAGLASLVLVAVSGILTWLIVLRRADKF